MKRVPGSIFRVLGFEFRDSGFGFQVSRFGFQVLGFEFRVSSFGFRVSNIGVSGLYLELGERDVERARREHLPRVRHRVGIHLDATVQNKDATTH